MAPQILDLPIPPHTIVSSSSTPITYTNTNPTAGSAPPLYVLFIIFAVLGALAVVVLSGVFVWRFCLKSGSRHKQTIEDGNATIASEKQQTKVTPLKLSFAEARARENFKRTISRPLEAPWQVVVQRTNPFGCFTPLLPLPVAQALKTDVQLPPIAIPAPALNKRDIYRPSMRNASLRSAVVVPDCPKPIVEERRESMCTSESSGSGIPSIASNNASTTDDVASVSLAIERPTSDISQSRRGTTGGAADQGPASFPQVWVSTGYALEHLSRIHSVMCPS